MNIFEQASRQSVRFDSPQGMLTVEDLWDLPLTSKTGRANLDDIARALHRGLKESDEVSFVTTKVTDSSAQLEFDIVKHIIDVKLEENKAALNAAANAAKKQQILALIQTKENENLAGQSLEDLQKMVQELT